MPDPKQSLAQFGQTIKAKHPEYADIGDEDVARKVLAKYPEYGDLVNTAPPQKGFFSSALDSSGLSGIGHALAHPIDTIASIPSSIKQAYQQEKVDLGAVRDNARKYGVLNDKTVDSAIYAIPGAGNVARTADQQADAKNYAGMAGTAAGFAGSILAPELLRGIPAKIPGALATTGNVLRDSGAGVIDKATGLLKPDFKHGATPGLGYLEGGGKPALTMRSLADKAQNVTNTAWAKLSDLYDGAVNTIPVDGVSKALSGPIETLRDLQGGVGGTGVSPSLEAYSAQMQPTLQAAAERGGFTPRELFDQVKKPIAKNTNWKDPTAFDLNTVRQQNVGAIGGLLTDAVPEAAAQNSIYQGASKLAARAETRANTGTPPFASIVNRGLEGGLGAGLAAMTHNPLLAGLPLALDTVAAKTGLGYGLYKAGQGATVASKLLPATAIPRSLANGLAIPANALIRRPNSNE